MEDNNCLLFKILFKIRPLGSSRMGMWATSDKYSSVPCLRFKFKDVEFDDPIYKQIENLVTNYQGGMKWVMTSYKEKTLNYFIFPEPFKDLGFFREKALEAMDEDAYKSIIDIAIDDVPNLAEYIEKNMIKTGDGK